MTERVRGSLYGRRKGKPLSNLQLERMSGVWPKLKISIDGIDAIHPPSLFGPRVEQVWLEIGFGSGEHLIHLLEKNSRIGMIGCEPFLNGLAKAVGLVDSGNHAGRVRLFDNDAALLLDRLESSSLSRAYLLYPDPWPKKKHWKRRFVSQSNLEKLARVLKSGAELRFASDIDSYADWALHQIQANAEFEWTANIPDDWRKPWPDWPSTRYEKKALKEGRKPTYLVFRRR